MKFKSKTFVLLLFLLSTNMYSQKDYFNFNQIKINDIAAIENSFDSKEYFTKYKISYSGRTEYAKPKLYNRKKKGKFPPASVDYNYTKKDSIVGHISYNWDINIDKEKDQSKRIEKCNAEFDKLVKLISKYIGEPAPNQGKTKLVESPVQSGDKISYESQRRVEWKYKDCTIWTILVWSKGHGEGFVTSIKRNE